MVSQSIGGVTLDHLVRALAEQWPTALHARTMCDHTTVLYAVGLRAIYPRFRFYSECAKSRASAARGSIYPPIMNAPSAVIPDARSAVRSPGAASSPFAPGFRAQCSVLPRSDGACIWLWRQAPVSASCRKLQRDRSARRREPFRDRRRCTPLQQSAEHHRLLRARARLDLHHRYRQH